MESFISERQETILALVIHHYIDSAQPVGSKRLVTLFRLGVSPATVRNEMATLGDVGLLTQPHTSAGRIPTEEGYRYFVHKLLGDTDLSTDEKHTISHQFHQAKGNIEDWLRLAASILARRSSVASLVTAPHPDSAIFKHLELIATQRRQVLLVLVLEGGEVHQQMLTIETPDDQTRLSDLASQISQLCLGKSAVAIARMSAGEKGLLGQILAYVAQIMKHADSLSAGEIYRDGLANVLGQPEFAGSEEARNALRLLEERSFLEEVVSKVLSPKVGGVQVVIGGEGAWDELKDCSIILSRYGAQGYATGALGVLGPTRMAYGKIISTMQYVARIMSALVRDTFTSGR